MSTTPKGGQKSPASVTETVSPHLKAGQTLVLEVDKFKPITIDPSKLTPADLETLKNAPLGKIEYVPSDRIPTPDGVNVEEVMKATAAIERERAIAHARANRHMSDCGTFRSLDCSCPANLANLPKALEEKMTGDLKWIRADEEHFITVRIPDPTQHRGPLINKQVLVQPLWICTGCGTSQRVPAPGGHACDPALLAWKAKPVPLSLTVPPEKRTSGAYRITIWRDAEFKYHVGEVIIDGDRVLAEAEHDVNGYYPASEATLSDMVAREFSP